MRKSLGNSVAIAATAVSLVASTSLPAAAHVRTVMRPVRESHVQREFTHLPSGLIKWNGVPPDYCDLPSAGCESYLSN